MPASRSPPTSAERPSARCRPGRPTAATGNRSLAIGVDPAAPKRTHLRTTRPLRGSTEARRASPGAGFFLGLPSQQDHWFTRRQKVKQSAARSSWDCNSRSGFDLFKNLWAQVLEASLIALRCRLTSDRSTESLARICATWEAPSRRPRSATRPACGRSWRRVNTTRNAGLSAARRPLGGCPRGRSTELDPAAMP
jgi:hypothetical protein